MIGDTPRVTLVTGGNGYNLKNGVGRGLAALVAGARASRRVWFAPSLSRGSSIRVSRLGTGSGRCPTATTPTDAITSPPACASQLGGCLQGPHLFACGQPGDHNCPAKSGRPDSNRGPHRPELRAPRSSRPAKSMQIGRFAVPGAAPDYARFVQISLSLGTGSAECLNQRLGIDCPSMAADRDFFCIAREQARIHGLPCFWRISGPARRVGRRPAFV